MPLPWFCCAMILLGLLLLYQLRAWIPEQTGPRGTAGGIEAGRAEGHPHQRACRIGFWSEDQPHEAAR